MYTILKKGILAKNEVMVNCIPDYYIIFKAVLSSTRRCKEKENNLFLYQIQCIKLSFSVSTQFLRLNILFITTACFKKKTNKLET